MQQNQVLFDCFFRRLPLLNKLPELVRDPDALAQQFDKQPDKLSFSVPRSQVDEYNRHIEQLTAETRKLPQQKFKLLLIMFVTIRMACVATAWWGSWSLTLAISLLQFIIMPASFFVSVCTLFVLSPAIVAAHYATIIPLHLGSLWLPDFLQWSMEIDNRFILILMVVDQLMCVACCIETPVGKSRHFGKKLIVHVVYGFFNCKTYPLILLLLLRGQQINMTVWLIDWAFGLTYRMAGLMSKILSHWAVIFYHQHRMAHAPRIYEQAHKFHHYLHDSTAFDAHLYGSGAPEEWLTLVVETGLCLAFGLCPATLSSNALMQSWANKIGHTRKEITQGGANHHADHHTYHRKNFGIYNAILDMTFDTNSNNDEYDYGNYVIRKSKDTDFVHFTCTLRADSQFSQKDMQDYYTPGLASYALRLIRRLKQNTTKDNN